MNRDFLGALRERVLVFDGAMGTMLQSAGLSLDDYQGLEGCSEILCVSRPDVVRDIHAAYFEAGADAVETNSFGSSAIVLAEYRGLGVGSMTELRRKARGSGVYLRVLKNTLARRAVRDTPFAKLADVMVGQLVYGISSDPVAPAKVMNEFAKGNEKFVIRAM